MRILIADDDAISRTLLTALLEKCQHEVLVACDGLEAWENLQQPGCPRLAIIDWNMPGLDGVEVCRRVKARETGPPPYLLLLTTRGRKDDIAEGLRAGADDYLAKPFDPEELSARIEAAGRMIALQDRLAGKVRELQEALDQVKTLSGILPICAGCKNIRDDQGYWSRVEAYLSLHSEVRFSHGLCPECLPKYYPEFVAGANDPQRHDP